MTEHSSLVSVRYMGEDVFPGRTTPALTFLAATEHEAATNVVGRNGAQPSPVSLAADERWWASHSEATGDVLAGLGRRSASLGDLVADPGVHTGNCSKRLILPADQATPDSVPVLEGRNIGRYTATPPTKVLRLGYEPVTGEYFRIRPEGRYSSAAFVIRQTAPEPIVGPREGATYFRNTLFPLYDPPDPIDVRYLVGLLNSKLLRWAYRESVAESGQRAFPQVKVTALRQLPIREIDYSDADDAFRHDELVQLVQRMLDLERAMRDTTLPPPDARRLQNERDAVDHAIDSLVYGLYELGPDERALVESRYESLRQ